MSFSENLHVGLDLHLSRAQPNIAEHGSGCWEDFKKTKQKTGPKGTKCQFRHEEKQYHKGGCFEQDLYPAMSLSEPPPNASYESCAFSLWLHSFPSQEHAEVAGLPAPNQRQNRPA